MVQLSVLLFWRVGRMELVGWGLVMVWMGRSYSPQSRESCSRVVVSVMPERMALAPKRVSSAVGVGFPVSAGLAEVLEDDDGLEALAAGF